MTAVMTAQHFTLTVISQRQRAARTAHRFAAVTAEDIAGLSAPIEEQNRLLLARQNTRQVLMQQTAEHAPIARFEFVAHIDNMDRRQTNRQGFIAWFIRQVVENREIQLYGDGGQLRDFVYVDDAAEAFLRAGASDACNGHAFNVGGSEPISLRDLVELLIDIAGTGRFRLVEWPPEKKAIDIGDFHADSSLIRSTLGWQPVR